MASDDSMHSPIPTGVAESYTPIADLIRPGLRLAFPLPVAGCADDERFIQLLAALAQRCDKMS